MCSTKLPGKESDMDKRKRVEGFHNVTCKENMHGQSPAKITSFTLSHTPFLIPPPPPPPYSLAEDTGFEFRLRRVFFGVESYQ